MVPIRTPDRAGEGGGGFPILMGAGKAQQSAFVQLVGLVELANGTLRGGEVAGDGQMRRRTGDVLHRAVDRVAQLGAAASNSRRRTTSTDCANRCLSCSGARSSRCPTVTARAPSSPARRMRPV